MAHDTAESHDHGGAHSDGHAVKIYIILLVLLFVSIAGPEVSKVVGGTAGMWITLITAFGVAFIKAGFVVKHFMHLTIERPIVRYLLVTCLVFVVLFFAGTAPDVMYHAGRNWENQAASQAIERALAEMAEVVPHDGHGAPGGDDHETEGASKLTHGPGVEGPPSFVNLPTDEAKQLWLMKTGESIYLDGTSDVTGSACVMCHRQDGAGYTGLASTLVEASGRIGTCEQTATVILHGKVGEVALEDGTVRRVAMPGFPDFDDEQLAAVTTYVRNSFGNSLGPCMPDDVRAAR